MGLSLPEQTKIVFHGKTEYFRFSQELHDQLPSPEAIENLREENG